MLLVILDTDGRGGNIISIVNATRRAFECLYQIFGFHGYLMTLKLVSVFHEFNDKSRLIFD